MTRKPLPRLQTLRSAALVALFLIALSWSPSRDAPGTLQASMALPTAVSAPAATSIPPKLLKKHAKRVLSLQAAQVDLVAALTAKSVASTDLLALLAQTPPAAKKVVKKAKAQLIKAGKVEKKALARVAKRQKKLQLVVAKIVAIDPTYFDGQVPTTGGVIDVPIILQEALPDDLVGVDRPEGVATFGLPFAMTDAVPVVAGRPALGIVGSDVWQFRTLDTWPDGSARWVLCDVQASVVADQALTGLSVVAGPGEAGGPPIGMQSQSKILLNTGPLQAIVRTKGFNLFHSVTVDGEVVIHDYTATGIVARGGAGESLAPGKNTAVWLEENGPARAVVRADGTLYDSNGKGHLDFTCRIIARRGSRDVEVVFTVRNASIDRPQHAVLDAIALVARVRSFGQPTVSASTHLGPVTQPLQPSADSTAVLYQAYSSAKTSGLGGAQYLPHLPTNPANNKVFLQQGYQLEIDGVKLNALGYENGYPQHAWLDLSGDSAGLTVGIQHMAYQWPAALEARGDGTVVVGLFPAQNPTPFTFVWRQHESRGAVFSFHGNSGADLSLPTRHLDVPLSGRAADYAHYDRAGVFPYDLLTESEHEQAYTLMGLKHVIVPDNPDLNIPRYLYKGTTGGSNNQAGIEIALGGDWLRSGVGGHYLNALSLALYKTEWQIRRSDDFSDPDDPGASNDEIPHSTGHFSDDEHRYREGIALAYYLTGDGRFRDALFDEAEILPGVSIWAHERSMYQTLRALAYVSEFTRDASLLQEVTDRLAYIATPIIDIKTATSGFGWEASPGQGARGYYVNSSDNKNEKPAGENFQARGFISASLGPLGYFHAARALPPGNPWLAVSRGRMQDLSRWTMKELFPSLPNPVDQRLVYSYAVSLQQVTNWENTDFHPILLGMAESWRDTGDAGFLLKGVEQIRAAAAHGDLSRWDTRLDVQHFLSAYREFVSAN